MGNFSNLIPTSLGETISVAIIEDQKPQTTNGGTFTSGAWRTRDLNTITADLDSIVTLNANQFTLQAGTYLIGANAPSYKVNRSTAQIYNITDGAEVAYGTVNYANENYTGHQFTSMEAQVTLVSPKTFEIRHQCQTTQASDGFGISSNYGTGVFTQVKITKVVPVVSSGVVAPVGAVAIIEDQKPSGTNGGTFTSGARRTRDLNTVTSDENSIVTLNANQFTLEAGTYEIEASAPALGVSSHQCFLQNITDATTDIVGKNMYADTASTVCNESTLSRVIVLSTTKTFEIQHECKVTKSGSGFGGNNDTFSHNVYTQVKITKKA